MTLDELKQEIVKRTGMPEFLLTGTTEEEVKAQARAALAERGRPSQPTDTREQFEKYCLELQGIEPQLPELDDLHVTGSYPAAEDAGEVSGLDFRSTREQFQEWALGKL